jgi:hypothetical protein
LAYLGNVLAALDVDARVRDRVQTAHAALLRQ